MNKDITLVILAAGMGSRFGGLKQITPLGPNDEFIIDYSVYDAIKAGFTKIVFLIKEENYDIFKETIGARVEPHIHVEYCFQKNDNVPGDYKELLKDRQKPLGTAHAILCCKNNVHEPFMIINADDFYGRDAFVKGAEFLKAIKDEKPYPYGMVGYLVKNTITENGTVKRGVCELSDGFLKSINESKCNNTEKGIYVEPLNGAEPYYTDFDTPVSVNLFAFYPNVFNYLEKDFYEFLKKSNNLLDDEFFLPTFVSDHVKSKDITCEVVESTAIWKGVTYRDDLDALKSYIEDSIKDGDYPSKLYE